MNEILSGLSSLPNLHPAVVHFPIALLPAAVILDVFLTGLKRQRGWLEPAASCLYAAAALGAGAAFWAGRNAVDSLPVGGVGLLLNGRGRVRILSLKVVPVGS